MKKKEWYEIQVTGNNPAWAHPMEHETVAKVKSSGLAFFVADKMKEIYKGDGVKVEVV